jgi:hypothetical protein
MKGPHRRELYDVSSAPIKNLPASPGVGPGCSGYNFRANCHSLPTVGDTDDVFYDPGRRLVYVIGGEGAVEVLRQHDPDHYERVGRIPTAPGARTGYSYELSIAL